MKNISLFYLVFDILLVATFVEGLDKFNQSECGQSKSCLRWSSCNFPNCDYAVSWNKRNYNGTEYLEIEIVGTLPEQTNGYIALGFSLENNMNHNGIVVCYVQNGQADIAAGYNVKPKNFLLPNNEIDQNLLVKSDGSRYGVQYDASTKTLRCRFLRLISPSLNVDKLLNLAGGIKYYLVNAKGRYDGKPRYHLANKRASNNSYNLESTSWVNDNLSPTNFVLVKCHACLMILGWVLFATNGIIMAYFYKNNWPEKKLFGGKIWFQFHQLVQSLCVICVSVAFIIIFVKVGGYADLLKLPYTAHPIMGIIATALMIINPIMAIFRCHPEDSSRWIFNTIHFIVGISAYILAISTIAIGIHLPEAGENLNNLNYPWILVLIFLFLIILLFIYGELRKIPHFQNTINIIKTSYNLSTDDQVEGVQKRPTGIEVIILSAIISVIFGLTFLIIVLMN